MPDWRDFDKIERITKIIGALVNETPLRVGTGGEPPLEAAVDIAVYRVNGTPCIPGSSLKGVLRYFAELLASSNHPNIHSPWEFDKMEEEAKSGDFCPICGIFGSTELASHVRIYDAYPKDGKSARPIIKPGVGISREFGAVQVGPFMEEFVPPKVEWSFEMDVINIKIYPDVDESDERAKLLRSLIGILRERGLNVGARKTIGCGLIRLKEAKCEVYEFKDCSLVKTSEGEI